MPLRRGTAPPSGSSVNKPSPPHPSRPRTSSLCWAAGANILSGLCSPVSACGFLQARSWAVLPLRPGSRGRSPHSGTCLPGPTPGSGRPSPAFVLSGGLGGPAYLNLRAGWSPGSPRPAAQALPWGGDTLTGTQCRRDGDGRDRVSRLSPSARRSPPSSSVHGWLLTHGAGRASTPRAGARWGRAQPGSFLLGAGAGCRLRSRASRLCVLLHVCRCCSLRSPPSLLSSAPPVPRLQAPIFQPGAGEASAGPDLFPTHPPKVSACPALPSVSPSVSADGLASRGVIKERGRQACVQQASGALLPRSSPRH